MMHSAFSIKKYLAKMVQLFASRPHFHSGQVILTTRNLNSGSVLIWPYCYGPGSLLMTLLDLQSQSHVGQGKPSSPKRILARNYFGNVRTRVNGIVKKLILALHAVYLDGGEV